MKIFFRQKQGSILLYTVLLLSVMLTAGIIVGEIVIRKVQISGMIRNSVSAISTADSVVEWCLFEARSESVIAVPVFASGATYQIVRTSDGSDISGDCTIFGSDPILFRATGTFHGVSRALEITE